MRILVISNFYPPHYIGGYELGCFEAVQGLVAKGHQVKVLTSSYGLIQPESDGIVYRHLCTYIGRSFTRPELLKKERHNQQLTRRFIRQFNPDVVYFWNVWQISLSLVYVAQQLGVPVCYYIFDHWLAQWSKIDDWFSWWDGVPATPLKRRIKKLLRHLLPYLGLQTGYTPPDLSRVQFASHFLKQQAVQAGRPVESSRVIYWGLKLVDFPVQQLGSQSPRRLLYVGQLVPHKGVHTLIEAFYQLVHDYGLVGLELTIVGGTVMPEYELQLKEQVQLFGLTPQVRFAGPQPRAQLSAIYQTHEIMVVPSTWDEPFGLTLLEAMASGLAVVGTATGGSAEILRHEANALIFDKEDPVACATCLQRLISDPMLFQQIRRMGRHTVEQHFRLEQTLDNIEQALIEAVGAT